MSQNYYLVPIESIRVLQRLACPQIRSERFPSSPSLTLVSDAQARWTRAGSCLVAAGHVVDKDEMLKARSRKLSLFRPLLPLEKNESTRVLWVSSR